MAQSPDVRDRTLAQPSAPLNDQPGTSAAPAAADPNRYSYQDFAAAVRRKYVTERGKDPYGDLADDQLVHAYLQRFPAYRAMVSDVMPEAGDVPGISSPVITPQPLGQMSDRARARLRAVEPPRLSPISHTPIPNPQTIEQGIEDDLTPAGAYAGPLGMIASMLSPRTKRLLQIPEQGITQAARGVGQMV